MPIYLFECKDCNASWDVVRRVKDIDMPGPPCPSCNKETVRIKNGTAPSIQFDDSDGWQTPKHKMPIKRER
jgi:putative FmdB family regulatory protein